MIQETGKQLLDPVGSFLESTHPFGQFPVLVSQRLVTLSALSDGFDPREGV